MKTQQFTLEVITPCFSGGAEPEKMAEIRAASVRGQLRWWFRALGGFQSLAPASVSAQEACLFGSVAGSGSASKLIVRVRAPLGGPVVSRTIKGASELNASVGSDRGYLLFPLRNRAKALFEAQSSTAFELHLVWKGPHHLWDDILALVSVFGSLGSLGFRSRRAMGALALKDSLMPLSQALARFTGRHQIHVRSLGAKNRDDAIIVLAGWLKGRRAHGRT